MKHPRSMSSKVLMAVATSLVALACVAPGHAQAPSDQSLAEAQQHLLSRENANARLALKVQDHAVELMTSFIQHLQANGVRFADMKTIVAAGSYPVFLVFAPVTSQPFIYADHNKIFEFGMQPYGEPVFSFRPRGGISVTLLMDLETGEMPADCTVDFTSGYADSGDGANKPPLPYHCIGFVHGDHDAALKRLLKQAIATSLGIKPAPPPKQKTPPNASGTKPSTASAPVTGAALSATNALLTAVDRSAVVNAIRPCWSIDVAAPGVSNFSVQLQVTTDAEGNVREAQVAPADQGKLTNPVFAAFAQRAVDATKNYQCAKLPLPSWMLGAQHQFTFRFSP